jgi:hypothetical protein
LISSMTFSTFLVFFLAIINPLYNNLYTHILFYST